MLFRSVIGFWILRHSGRSVTPLLVALAIALGLLASQQVAVWRNDETLLRRALAKVGNHAYRGDLTWRLANALSRDGRKAEAQLWYEETLRIALNSQARAAAHHGLGMLQIEKGDEAAALANCGIASTLAPSVALYQQWHAYLLLRAGRSTEAAEAVRRGLQSDPLNTELRQYAEGLRRLLQPSPQ